MSTLQQSAPWRLMFPLSRKAHRVPFGLEVILPKRTNFKKLWIFYPSSNQGVLDNDGHFSIIYNQIEFITKHLKPPYLFLSGFWTFFNCVKGRSASRAILPENGGVKPV